MTTIRDLTEDELTDIDEKLDRLRTHFCEWPTIPGKEWYLVDFAYYEGCGHRDECCVRILGECASIALGKTLVTDHGFHWCMIESNGELGLGVRHPGIAEPIDFDRLKETPLLHPDHHDDDMDPFDPGEGAHESMHAILAKIGQKVTYD